MINSTFSKIITRLVLFSLIILTIKSIDAQTINEENSLSSDYFIEYFKAIELNKKLYFKFLIQENNDNIAYVLELSENGNEFKSIQIKEGFKSPNETPLLYCFSEKITDNENSTYRIKRISNDGVIDYSCPIIINKIKRNKRWVSCKDEENLAPLKLDNKFNDENQIVKSRIILEEKNDIESMVSIYPNPNIGKVNIDLGSLKNVTIRIFNLSGKLIHQKEKITDSIYHFEFNEIPGIYFVDINVQNDSHRFTFVKS
jgi:hypothetical protein